MTARMQVEGLVAFLDLQGQVLHVFGIFAAENFVAVLVHGNRVTRPHAHHQARMHGIALLHARRQVQTASGLVGSFQGLEKDTVTDDHDIL